MLLSFIIIPYQYCIDYINSDVKTVRTIGAAVGVQAHKGNPEDTERSFLIIVQNGTLLVSGEVGDKVKTSTTTTNFLNICSFSTIENLCWSLRESKFSSRHTILL